MTETTEESSSVVVENEESKPLKEDMGADDDESMEKESDVGGANGEKLNLFSKCYIGIVFNYFAIGFTPSFLSNPLTIYMINTLNASPASQNTVGMLLTLPWCFKVIYGFMSDAYPLLDYKRKSYLMIGNIVAVVALVVLGAFAAKGELTVESLGWLVFIQTAGMILSDVMSDAYCVELSKRFESTDERGSVQAMAYGTRFLAAIVGSAGGTFLYNQRAWGWGLSFETICFACAAFQCISFPTLLLLDEKRASDRYSTEEDKTVSEQIGTIWEYVQLRAVWQPMLYIYFYNVMQIPNAAWNSFLVKGLNFSAFEMGMLNLVGAIMTFAGLIVFKKLLFNTSWRYIYVITTLLGLLFSVLQLLLVYRVNLKIGLDDFAFSSGDNVFAAFVGGIQFMPTVVMMVGMCPDGQEGASFAMFTTFSNLAMAVGAVVGNMIVNIWDCSNEAMEAHHFDGLGNLTILTSVLQVIPIFFVYNLPDSREEQKKTLESGESSSFYGGLFMTLLLTSLVVSVTNAVYELH